jgi:hypothetical protein
VDITAVVDDALLRRLEGLGLEILDAHPGFRSLRARAPLSALEAVGADPSVLFVAPARRPRVRLADTDRGTGVGSARSAVPFEADAVNVSQGDVTHRANLARATYGVSGANIRIGVLSDGVDSLASLQASGDLPPGVTVLPGQAGSGNEGAAILEIVHDLAPKAQLFFATANDGLASMAQNIHDLRAAGCDILIDDVIYFVETPFQKGQAPGVPSTTNAGLILQAIDDVAAGGALYFTAAGNDGNLDSGTSGTWEGDFHDAGAAGAPISGTGRLHDFDPAPESRIRHAHVGRRRNHAALVGSARRVGQRLRSVRLEFHRNERRRFLDERPVRNAGSLRRDPVRFLRGPADRRGQADGRRRPIPPPRDRRRAARLRDDRGDPRALRAV